MRLFVLGVGDTFSEKHVTHAILLEHDGFRLAIDCPDSYRRVLRRARDRGAEAAVLDLFAIDDVLVTHVEFGLSDDSLDVRIAEILCVCERWKQQSACEQSLCTTNRHQFLQ